MGGAKRHAPHDVVLQLEPLHGKPGVDWISGVTFSQLISACFVEDTGKVNRVFCIRVVLRTEGAADMVCAGVVLLPAEDWAHGV